jgi:hypothetical protein
MPQIDDLSLRDHLVAQHAPRPGWREEFSLDASNVFVFEKNRRDRRRGNRLKDTFAGNEAERRKLMTFFC